MPEEINQGAPSSNGTADTTVTPTASPNVNAANTGSSSSQSNVNDVANQPQVYIPEATKQKYSQLESENANFKKELEADKSERETLAQIKETFKNDPVAYEAFRASFNKRTGASLEDYNTIYGNKTPAPTTNSGGNQNSTNDYTKFEQYSGLSKFLDSNPNYNPSKAATPEEAKDRNFVLTSIASKANEIKQSNPYISTEEAFSQAKVKLAELVTGGNGAIENARKAGEIAGKQSAFATGAATGGISGGDAAKTDEGIDYSKFTEEQQAYFKTMSKKDPERAKRVAKLALKELE